MENSGSYIKLGEMLIYSEKGAREEKPGKSYRGTGEREIERHPGKYAQTSSGFE